MLQNNSDVHKHGKKYLVRFRADPRRVRVTVRHLASGWLACVTSRAALPGAFGFHKLSPVRAMVIALQVANKLDMDGVDLDMGCAYDHPQGQLAYALNPGR